VSKAHGGFDSVLSMATLQRLFLAGALAVALLLLALLTWGGRRLWSRRRRHVAPAKAGA
jgi:hypothetical protein